MAGSVDFPLSSVTMENPDRKQLVPLTGFMLGRVKCASSVFADFQQSELSFLRDVCKYQSDAL